jgi:hypothetical protein
MARKPTTPSTPPAPTYKVRPFYLRIVAFALATLFLVSLIGMVATRTVLSYELQSDIGHKVEEGFHTVSGPASSEQLGQAIRAAEEMGYTDGYTNWLWKSKCGDIGFWYETLKQAKADVDRASYERAWAPEADENVILQRHYFVLVTTYGDDMLPCAMHLMPNKAFFDLWAWSLLPNGVSAAILMVVQAFKGDERRKEAPHDTKCLNCKREGFLHYDGSCEGYTVAPHVKAGFWTTVVKIPAKQE